MAEFKCPCCGGAQFIEVNTISQHRHGEGYTEEECDRYGNIQKKPVHYECRGLFNFGFSIWGDAKGTASIDANCTTRICADCGFVSLNALELAKEILSDMAEIVAAEKELLDEQASIPKEIEALQKELDTESHRKKEIQKKLGDENITIKQQRELQEELAVLQTKEMEIPNQIRLKQIEVEKLSVALRNLQQRKAIIHGYRIIK